jgi:hypothetical protein
MPMFMCRWPNGDVSFRSARNKEDAIIMLDEWDNAELAALRQIRDFMVDFRLTDKGELEFQSFGEDCQNEIRERAYPILAKALDDAPTKRHGRADSCWQEQHPKSRRGRTRASCRQESSQTSGHGVRQSDPETVGSTGGHD